MLDCKGKEILPNQKVVFSVGTRLVTGTVASVRHPRGMYAHVDFEIAKILLDEPERRFGQCRYEQDAQGNWQVINGDEKTPRLARECSESVRIMVLDNSTK